ncbi:MAG: 4Fe-4S dicluster domain-containing protein [Proteobacteria bacterium]|jgi:Fe-S oxidoreductase|nr:4Fe-4S dicluster domain-containing protein [Pseudomonadota bacterium]
MNTRVEPELYREVEELGAKDMELCMQCGTCAASCPLSSGNNPFPRKLYRYLQLGLRDKLLASPEPWLCYYCGDCNNDCPRGAEPAETMMAIRRWLTMQYDWTGLAKKFYLSAAWEMGALGAVALFVVLLFAFFHGPVITDHMAVDTFAPVIWVEIGDLTMGLVLSLFLFSNAFRMFRYIMADTKVPLWVYLVEAKTFVIHLFTQRRWRQCGEDRSRWLKHFILVTGYMTMMTLIIVCLRWFQVDDTSWHFSALFGYYATAVLLIIPAEMFYSRLKKQEALHRYSELSDWLFLILLFATALTGIMMHAVRLSGWPLGTYLMYVIHLAIAVPMLVIEVPFGKWSHLFYRPLAAYLSAVKERASQESEIDRAEVEAKAGELFLSCMHCGTCTSMCPQNLVSPYSPRQILRSLATHNSTVATVDEAAWDCLTCNTCGTHCPRGINIVDILTSVRDYNVDACQIPKFLQAPQASLAKNGNPWGGSPAKRTDWANGLNVEEYSSNNEYCLFTCCTTAYDPNNKAAAQALPTLLDKAGVSYGTLGVQEKCCGDPAHNTGASATFDSLVESNTKLFESRGVQKILVTSPHCHNTFQKHYPGSIESEHYTQLLDRLLSSGKLQPTKKLERTVTYHDPCYLGRHSGIYEAPRRVLKSIPGLKLVEMPMNKAQSICCGGGGGGAFNDKRGKENLGVLRVREALDTGADVIATACPYCIRMLNDAVKTLGVKNRIAVQDITELLNQAEMTKGVEMPERVELTRVEENCHV